MELLIFYLALALIVSFVCSLLEAVLLSVTPSYIEAHQHTTTGRLLRRLKQDIDRPLAAILTLNTAAHTAGATGVGAQAVLVFGDAYTGLISAGLTLAILILSEIIPKTLGALYWHVLTPITARLLIVLIWPFYPFVLLSQGITRLLSRKPTGPSVSREELAALAELGRQQGVFEQEELRILKNLLRFRALRAKDVMTPRTVIFALPENLTLAEVLRRYPELRFSRIPIYRESRDQITGYVLKDEVLLRAARDDGEVPLHRLRREILVVPETLPLLELFERMLNRLEHIALVIDEYGGTAGIVTLEDIVETLLGLEIVDEADATRDMQELAREQWRRRAERLGLLPEVSQPSETASAERAAVIRLGLTGKSPS
ncbi:hemolysin family protein [Rhodothermus bifroesti]|jgi:CBS domain containing-hemolysin-like protein|uniref:HlyC/CorC family transporter n=1 Tax=Rhodothermus marinus TaxID=29549 RepID=A0A7V2F6H2_RHOMR|nr:hemolysin family protein [Rhodothermus bifroesti]GBD01235.1 Magnesium and cobalt efflux protein CorC [bacterium HR18]